jgi:ribonuclease HI
MKKMKNWLVQIEKYASERSLLTEELASTLQKLQTLMENWPTEPQASMGIEEKISQLTPPRELEGTHTGLGLYADGACRGNPGKGSWAYVLQDQTGKVISYKSGRKDDTTNNQMELQAAIESLKASLDYLMHSKLPAEKWDKIVFVSDSKYVIEGLKSWVPQWESRGWKKADGKAPENLGQWQELHELKKLLSRLQYQWVKGHAQHPQNSLVDWMCNFELDKE